MIFAVLAALAFHLTPAPNDVSPSPSFQLGGYTVTSECSEAKEYAEQCVRAITDLPQYVSETEMTRAFVRLSFIAPVSGTCVPQVVTTLSMPSDTVIGLSAASRVMAATAHDVYIAAVAGQRITTRLPWRDADAPVDDFGASYDVAVWCYRKSTNDPIVKQEPVISAFYALGAG
jgi:hypothetical protein